MVYAVVTVAVSWLLIKLFPVVLVVIVALFLFGTLEPLVDWLEAHRCKRGLAIGLVFTVTLLGTLLLLGLTLPSLFEQLKQLVEKVPELRTGLANQLSKWSMGRQLADSVRKLRLEEVAKLVASGAFAYSGRVAEVIAYGASAAFLALYVMIDRDRLRGALFSLVPRGHHVRLARVLLNLETIVGGYIRGQVITSALMALFTFILLTSCGVQSALALAVFAGFADALPYLGVLLAVGPAVIAAIARGPGVVAIVLCAMLAYEELESRFIIPRVYGHVLRLPSSVILFALLTGGTLMGVMGALLSLPVAAAIRMLIIELRIELPGEAPRDAVQQAHEQRIDRRYEAMVAGVPAVEASAVALELADDPANQGPEMRAVQGNEPG